MVKVDVGQRGFESVQSAEILSGIESFYDKKYT